VLKKREKFNMSDDLVERLNNLAAVEGEPTASALKEAADRIEKLEAALRLCACDCDVDCSKNAPSCESWIARKALEAKDD
jgi:hypothetical protein